MVWYPENPFGTLYIQIPGHDNGPKNFAQLEGKNDRVKIYLYQMDY